MARTRKKAVADPTEIPIEKPKRSSKKSDTLEALAEKHGLIPASELPRQLPPAEPTLDSLPEKPRKSHVDAVMSRRPDFAPVPDNFMNVVRHETAGIRVNKSHDKRVGAIQFSEDRPLSRATEYDLMERIQDAGFQFKPANRQWERLVPEGMAPGENIVDATRLAKEIADARIVGRER